MARELPFSQACDNNKAPILSVLARAFVHCRSILEVGSGTGQHAVYFAENLPHLTWQTSDQPHYHDGIHQWITAFPSANILSPLVLIVGESMLPFDKYDGVFTANTAHIMQKDEVVAMMSSLSTSLPQGAVFCQYGPFTRDGVFSSDSNAQFHQRLLEQGYGGYRDIRELMDWAPALTLTAIHTMPANNLLLEWVKA